MAITPSTTNKKKNTEIAAANTGIVTPSVSAGGQYKDTVKTTTVPPYQINDNYGPNTTGTGNTATTTPKTTPGATPSSPKGYNPAGNGGTGNANKPTNEDKIQADTGVAPPPAKSWWEKWGETVKNNYDKYGTSAPGTPESTGSTLWEQIGYYATPKFEPYGPDGKLKNFNEWWVYPEFSTSKDDTSKDDGNKESEKDDAEKDDTGSGTTPPPEDVVASIIAAASSSNNAADELLKQYSELIGTGVKSNENLTQMIKDAIAGATVADTGGPALETAIAAINSALAGHNYQDYRIDKALENIKSFDGYGGGQALSDFSNILYRNANKSDTYSDAIYGYADFMKDKGLDLMEYMKGYNPLNTDWGRGVLDYYGIQSVDASNNANAAGAADNGGNIDSYAAANAERQRLSTLGQGINAISGMTNDRFSNLLNTFNSIGVNVNNLLGLEGQYNLPFMKDQLAEAGDLAESLYKTDADAIKEYNDNIIKLIEAGNTNAANRGNETGVAGVASGLAGTMAQANVDAQKDKNDFVSSLINAEGALNLPALINLINGAGSVGSGLYATDAQTTANLYNYLASMYGGGVESSNDESTSPNAADIQSYISYMKETFPDLSDEELITKLIEYVPDWKNSAGYIEWLAGLGEKKTQ